eukprot:365590-Chlamydomonas_euryale.AAC.12
MSHTAMTWREPASRPTAASARPSGDNATHERPDACAACARAARQRTEMWTQQGCLQDRGGRVREQRDTATHKGPGRVRQGEPADVKVPGPHRRSSPPLAPLPQFPLDAPLSTAAQAPLSKSHTRTPATVPLRRTVEHRRAGAAVKVPHSHPCHSSRQTHR